VSSELGDYRVPGAIARHVNCWSQSEQAPERLLNHTELSCQSEDDIFLSGDLSTGAIRYEHALRSARRVGVLRFWAQLERSFRSFFGNFGGDEASVTRFSCHQDFFEHAGLKSKLVLCVRRYREFDGLYDLVQRQVVLGELDRSLQSTLILTGVDREHGIAFARRFAEEIRRTRP
jgi:hypothetical protein